LLFAITYIDKSYIIIHDHHPARTTRPGTVPDNAGNFVVAVLRAEIFRIFADDFRPVPARKYRKFTEIHGKKPEQFATRILGPSIENRWALARLEI
jgi:hypothetical protein